MNEQVLCSILSDLMTGLENSVKIDARLKESLDAHGRIDVGLMERIDALEATVTELQEQIADLAAEVYRESTYDSPTYLDGEAVMDYNGGWDAP